MQREEGGLRDCLRACRGAVVDGGKMGEATALLADGHSAMQSTTQSAPFEHAELNSTLSHCARSVNLLVHEVRARRQTAHELEATALCLLKDGQRTSIKHKCSPQDHDIHDGRDGEWRVPVDLQATALTHIAILCVAASWCHQNRLILSPPNHPSPASTARRTAPMQPLNAASLAIATAFQSPSISSLANTPNGTPELGQFSAAKIRNVEGNLRMSYLVGRSLVGQAQNPQRSAQAHQFQHELGKCRHRRVLANAVSSTNSRNSAS